MVLKIKTLQAISDEYTVGKELGKGTYGTVNICSHNSKPEATDTVIKNIDLHKLKRKDIADLMKEAKLLQMFDHPNVTFERPVCSLRTPFATRRWGNTMPSVHMPMQTVTPV